MSSSSISRRSFLKRSFAYSAAAGLLGTTVGCGSGVSAAGSFDAAHLLMVGDWGEAGTPTDQAAVAAGMRNYASSHGLTTQALLMLGDNFYGPLKGGVGSARWQTQFEQMYPKTVFNCPAYGIPGNHDYEVSPEAKYPAELAYAAQGGTRWTMPAQWYSFVFPQKDPLITFLALDSNMPFEDGATMHGQFYAMTEEQRVSQLAWLTTELEKPLVTPFRVVMGHHPLYSDGPHGDNSILIRDWDPLFRKHNVHAYLAGHDHDMQHLEFDGHPTSFFLSGGGGADLYNLKIQETTRGPWAEKIHGFSHLECTRAHLTFRHLDESGNVLHSFSKSPDGKVALMAGAGS